MMEILICPECGVKNLPTAENCRACGASLSDVQAMEISELPESSEDELDLLPQAENDLPGLFQDLKENGEMGDGAEVEQGDQEPASLESTDNFETDETEADQSVPDWLHRIRQRASEDPDSIGEITQKISAARENLDPEMSDSQHQDFENWIRSLRHQNGEEAKEVSFGDDTELSDLEPEWLKKIREERGKAQDNQEGRESPGLPDRGGDSLLQWLVTLEDGVDETPQDIQSLTEGDVQDGEGESTRKTVIYPQEIEDDATQEIGVDSTEIGGDETPTLEVSREEKIQADQLSATIVDEKASRPIRKPKTRSSGWVVRLIMAVVLIGGISLSLKFGGITPLPQDLLQPHNQALLSWSEDLPSDASLLLVFDYQPGFSHELALVAKPILGLVLKPETQVTILSTRPSGGLLSQQMLSEMNLVEELTLIDLGYYPVGVLAAYGAANRPLIDLQIEALPAPAKPLPTGEYDGVLILSDTYEGARVWVEQFSVLRPAAPINLLTTAQAGPMLLPYWDSGQVTGMVSGISEAGGIESVLAEDTDVSVRWKAYQTGLLILIAILLIGGLFMEEGSKKDEGQGAP